MRIISKGVALVGLFLVTQHSLAGNPDAVVPEMDGAGVIIGIALVAGLVALFREKIFRK